MIVNNSESKNYLATLYLIFTMIIFPAFALNEGLKYIKENEVSLRVKDTSQELGKFTNSLKIHSDEESFWLNKLTVEFTSAKTPEHFFSSITQLCRAYEVDSEVILYDGEGNYYRDNFLPSGQEPWKEIGQNLLQVVGEPNSDERFAAMTVIRKVLGPNFYINYNRAGNLSIPKTFFQTDFSRQTYKYWFARSKEMIAVIRFKFAELEKSTGLRFFAKNFHKHEKVAIFRGNTLLRSEIPEVEAKFFFHQFLQNLDQEFMATDTSVYTLCRISNDSWALIKKDFVGSFIKPGKFTAAIFLLLFGMFLILRQSEFIPRRFSDFSILGQIFVLMAISAGVPLVILAFVATGYFNNKRTALIHEENQRMIEFVQQINENTKSEMSMYSRFFAKTIADCSDLLKSNFSKSDLEEFNNRIKKHDRIEGYLIKNDDFFYVRETPKHENERRKMRRSDSNRQARDIEQKNVKVIANHHLSYLNDKPPKPISIETAYIMEMFFQKPVPMIIHDFVNIEGHLTPTGWGSDVMMLFIQSLKLSSSQFFDTYLVLSFTADIFELYYIRNHLHNIIRNPNGYQIYMILSDRVLMNSGKSLLDFPDIRELARKTTDYPLPEPVIQDFKEKPHIFVGLNGNKIKTFKFCVLYPLEKIEKLIQQEAGDLINLSALAVAIVFFMILTLYLNLLFPVNRLRQAAHALEVRDANFRLPEDRSDEFGEMARVFNTSIAEFEELQIAGIVQNRLLPTSSLEFSAFSVFGHSVPMAFLGGDYFDYFKIDEQRFAALLGDVAGHGVGASLIMAIAKAGVLSATDVNHDPALLLGRLHQIILATKSRLQRKVMTFQYLLVDQATNKVTYANAGGCSPVIVDKRAGTIKVISHPGAVLGGFKKNVFKNLELELQPDQAIILYTDGMVESRNHTGNELGYSGLYEIFLQSFDSDATVYYQNIYRNFSTWLGESDAGDDLTVMVTVCKNRKDS